MTFGWIYKKCVFLFTWLDSDLGHRELQRRRHTLGLVVVIYHGPYADEPTTMAGTVDHGLLCSGGELGRTLNIIETHSFSVETPSTF